MCPCRFFPMTSSFLSLVGQTLGVTGCRLTFHGQTVPLESLPQSRPPWGTFGSVSTGQPVRSRGQLLVATLSDLLCEGAWCLSASLNQNALASVQACFEKSASGGVVGTGVIPAAPKGIEKKTRRLKALRDIWLHELPA